MLKENSFAMKKTWSLFNTVFIFPQRYTEPNILFQASNISINYIFMKFYEISQQMP